MATSMFQLVQLMYAMPRGDRLGVEMKAEVERILQGRLGPLGATVDAPLHHELAWSGVEGRGAGHPPPWHPRGWGGLAPAAHAELSAAAS